MKNYRHLNCYSLKILHSIIALIRITKYRIRFVNSNASNVSPVTDPEGWISKNTNKTYILSFIDTIYSESQTSIYFTIYIYIYMYSLRCLSKTLKNLTNRKLLNSCVYESNSMKTCHNYTCIWLCKCGQIYKMREEHVQLWKKNRWRQRKEKRHAGVSEWVWINPTNPLLLWSRNTVQITRSEIKPLLTVSITAPEALNSKLDLRGVV